MGHYYITNNLRIHLKMKLLLVLLAALFCVTAATDTTATTDTTMEEADRVYGYPDEATLADADAIANDEATFEVNTEPIEIEARTTVGDELVDNEDIDDISVSGMAITRK